MRIKIILSSLFLVGVFVAIGIVYLSNASFWEFAIGIAIYFILSLIALKASKKAIIECSN